MDKADKALKPALRLFLVDDSAPIRARMAGLLGKLEGVCIVGEAASSAAATSAILDTVPDAVLLDLRLAPGTGFDVLKAVHPRHPRIVFIVLTNHASPQYRRLCMDCGASHFLDKSHEFSQVADILAGLRTCAHGNAQPHPEHRL